MKKITIKRILAETFMQFILLIITLSLPLYLYCKFGFGALDPLGVFLVIFFWTLYVLYVGLYPFAIYLNYYRHDKHAKLSINANECYLIYTNKEKDYFYKFDQIDIIKGYYSPKKMLSMYYFKIIFKDNTSIVVTSFIAGNLHKIIKEVPYKVYRLNNLFLKQDNKL